MVVRAKNNAMCRIAGFWDFNSSPGYTPEKVLFEMGDSLAHGGPDDGGIYIDKALTLGLAHRRLSIIDLSPTGHQPMVVGDKIIIYNGELYNFQELKTELEAAGHRFHSHSDTEVIVKALDTWGLGAVNRFNGMWAFAIWDKTKRELLLCRDRLGVKPLYWYRQNKVFLFASELKAFHRHPGFRKQVDSAALSSYLSYGYIPAPLSIFSSSYKLEPGHFLICNDRGEVKIQRYWDISERFNRPKLDISAEQAVEEGEAVLSKAFSYRLVSDVPVGLFLSSGYDSAAVAALLSRSSRTRLKTFSIGFPDKTLDEAEGARRIAAHLGTDHNEHYCSPADFKEILPDLPQIYDEPFGDGSAIPTILVSRFARKHVKVALSADGGDELFSGYGMYKHACDRAQMLSLCPNFAKSFAAGAMRFIPGGKILALAGVSNSESKYLKVRELMLDRDGALGVYRTYMKYFSDFQASEIFPGFMSRDIFAGIRLHGQDSDIQELLCATAKTYLTDDIMHKVDRATMSVGLEGREPFLDPAVIDFASSLPIRFKQADNVTKWLVRRIVDKYIPDGYLIKRKQGFSAPLEKWVREEASSYLNEYLSAEKVRKTGLLSPVAVENVRQAYLSGRGSFSQAWLLLVFMSWHEKWIG